MATLEQDYPFLKKHANRHKRMVYYVRKRGQRLVRLPDLEKVGIATFDAAYRAAVAQPGAPRKSTSLAAPAYSGNALLGELYASDWWLNTLKPNSQALYRRIYTRWAAEWGLNDVRKLTRKEAQQILKDRAATPFEARNLLKRLNVLFDLAVELEWRADNPFRTLKLKAIMTEGFAPWSDAEIEQFNLRWPSGTPQRRALVLLLHTTQRRSDVHRMGPQHLLGGCIDITQVKGRKGVAPTRLLLPVHPELAIELAHVPDDAPAFITTPAGGAYTANGFGEWFTRQAQVAGLQSRTAHGLRKSGARRHAEAGSGAPQIAAMTGHKTLAEVERYIRSAQQPKLAAHAMATLTDPPR